MYYNAVFVPMVMRRSLAVGLAAVLFAIVRPEAAVERRDTIRFDQHPTIDLHIVLSADRDRDADRVLATARDALQRLVSWFGEYRYTQVTIVDARAAAGDRDASRHVIAISTPWWSAEQARTLDADVMTAVARDYWTAAGVGADGATWWRDALAAFASGRAVGGRFDTPASYEARFFGDWVPFLIRGLAVPPQQLMRRSLDARALRAVRALETLDRYLGWATLQQALLAFASRARKGHATPDDLASVLEEISGRELSWFFNGAFGTAKVFDFGIDSVTSVADGDRYSTKVVAARYGDGLFAGSSRPREAPFESGSALEVVIRFADGTEIRERWDGRDTRKEFAYDSATRAVSATIDPGQMVRLDANPLNNTRTARPSRTAAVSWSARWLIWMQDLMVTYAFLV